MLSTWKNLLANIKMRGLWCISWIIPTGVTQTDHEINRDLSSATFTLHRKDLKTQQSPIIFDLCWWKLGGEITWFTWPQSFPSTRKQNPVLSNSSGLKSAFENLRFRDGLVWTKGLTVEKIKATFSNPSEKVWTGLKHIYPHKLLSLVNHSEMPVLTEWNENWLFCKATEIHAFASDYIFNLQ